MSKLQHEAIIAEAMRLIERDGEAALSMRTLATGLGVTPMALYRYFANRDELLLALVDRVSRTIEFPEPTGDPVDSAVDLALCLHDFLADHPWMIRLISSGRLASPAGLTFPEGFIACAHRAGRTDDEAFIFYRTMFATILGTATITNAKRESGPANLPDPAAAEQVPLVTKLAPRWAELDATATPAAILRAAAQTLTIA